MDEKAIPLACGQTGYHRGYLLTCYRRGGKGAIGVIYWLVIVWQWPERQGIQAIQATLFGLSVVDETRVNITSLHRAYSGYLPKQSLSFEISEIRLAVVSLGPICVCVCPYVSAYVLCVCV